MYLSTIAGSLLSSIFTFIYLLYRVVTHSSGSSCLVHGNYRGADGGFVGGQGLSPLPVLLAEPACDSATHQTRQQYISTDNAML
jgi:hypothetical protein